MADIYKWTDEKGVVHYGDQGNKGARQLEVEGFSDAAQPATSDRARQEKRRRVSDAMEEDRIEKKEAREQKRAQKQKQQVTCSRYRDKLRQYEKSSGIYNLDSNGERVFLSNKNKDKTITRMRKRISKNCR